MAYAGNVNMTPVEDKTVEDEPLPYASKQAKNAFKALLESANVEADWNWEQAMRVMINDKRYGALKTLGERKHAFQEESRELTSSMRWSKAAILFENDERFKVVERAVDREDLFKNYLVDLQKVHVQRVRQDPTVPNQQVSDLQTTNPEAEATGD